MSYVSYIQHSIFHLLITFIILPIYYMYYFFIQNYYFIHIQTVEKRLSSKL